MSAFRQRSQTDAGFVWFGYERSGNTFFDVVGDDFSTIVYDAGLWNFAHACNLIGHGRKDSGRSGER